MQPNRESLITPPPEYSFSPSSTIISLNLEIKTLVGELNSVDTNMRANLTVDLNLVDTNNRRTNQDSEPNMDTTDWRGQLQPESRQRVVNKIMDTLKRHLSVSSQEGLHELRKIGQRFEEKIFTAATSQSDYLRKISMKMLTMENGHQGTMANYIPPNQVVPNNKPPNPGPFMQSQVYNNWRPNQGAEPNMDTSGDWRGQLQPESRQRIVNKIMDTLKNHLPVSGQEGLHELRKIAQSFEEKIFTAATSQSDYLRKISLKMLTMETKSQGTMANNIPPNQVGPSNKPPDPGLVMQSHVHNQGQQNPISLPNQPQSRQQLLSQNIQNNIASQPNLQSVSGQADTPIPNVVQYSNIQNMFNASQRQMQGRQQVVPQQHKKQQSQNPQQYVYQQQLYQSQKPLPETLSNEMAPKMKMSKLAKLVSEGENSGITPSILKDWRNDKPASSPILEKKRKRDAAVGTSQQVPGVVTHDRKLTVSSSVPNVSANVITSIPAHNSFGPARSDVSSQQMSIPKLDDVFTRKCRGVQGEIEIKVPNPDGWIKHLPEFVDNGESASKSVWNVANSYSELVDSLTQKEDGERMNNAGDVGVCAASSSYLLRALCGIRHLEESTYNREYLLEMAMKDKEELQKRLDDLGDAEQEIKDLRSEIDAKTQVLEAERKSLIEADKTIVDARTQLKFLESEVEKLKTDIASLQEEVVSLKKTNTDLEAANHEYEVKAAVAFAAGFAEAIAQVQALAPEVDISEAHYTKEIRDGQLVIASDEDEGDDEEDSGKKLVDVQDDQIHAIIKSKVKHV